MPSLVVVLVAEVRCASSCDKFEAGPYTNLFFVQLQRFFFHDLRIKSNSALIVQSVIGHTLKFSTIYSRYKVTF